MAVQVKDLARQVIARIGASGGYELAGQWVGYRYTELASRARFRHLRQYGQAYLPAPITTGTVTFTQDSPTVTGDATALAAWQTNQFFKYPDGFTGLFFRPFAGRTWYRIAEVSGNTITLETPFAADNGALFGSGSQQANQTYYIIPRYLKLDPTARTLGVFVCDFMYRPLRLLSEDQLNRYYPNRFLVWSYPQVVAELNQDLTDTGMPKVVEIYPWPTSSVTMHYTFWQHPPILKLDDVVPTVIDPDILYEGAMIDAFRQEMSKALRAGQVEAATVWRNEMRTQQKDWDTRVARAIRNDRGADDLKFILSRGGWRRFPVDYDPITSAYENFLARGF